MPKCVSVSICADFSTRQSLHISAYRKLLHWLSRKRCSFSINGFIFLARLKKFSPWAFRASGSASASRRSIAASIFTNVIAMCRGVFLRLFQVLTSAPASIRRPVTIGLPRTARCRGVFPSLFRTLTSAPASISFLTTAGLPLNAALCMGVAPYLCRALISAPALIRAWTAALLPLIAAICSGDSPSSDCALISAPVVAQCQTSTAVASLKNYPCPTIANKPGRSAARYWVEHSTARVP